MAWNPIIVDGGSPLRIRYDRTKWTPKLSAQDTNLSLKLDNLEKPPKGVNVKKRGGGFKDHPTPNINVRVGVIRDDKKLQVKVITAMAGYELKILTPYKLFKRADNGNYGEYSSSLAGADKVEVYVIEIKGDFESSSYEDHNELWVYENN